MYGALSKAVARCGDPCNSRVVRRELFSSQGPSEGLTGARKAGRASTQSYRDLRSFLKDWSDGTHTARSVCDDQDVRKGAGRCGVQFEHSRVNAMMP